MMTLREKQTKFWIMVSQLIHMADVLKTPVFISEWLRSEERQQLMVRIGASKTMDSKHLQGLAVDLIFLEDVQDDGRVNFDADKYRELGEFWESLDKDNVWGGRWGDDTTTAKIEGWDSGHFQMGK